ncbi:MAG: hypothetical protein WBP12_02645 [Candidatus Saccharimonas sp.]
MKNLLQSEVVMEYKADLSWIQKYVLLILIRTPSARVKELMPPDIASNLFAYHLDGLVAAKLIEKAGRGVYRLTTKGEKFVGTFSTMLDKQVEKVKTVIILYGHKDDQYLLFRWSRQPYLGNVSLVHDHVAFGKSLDDGLHSALSDKLGRTLPLTYKCSALVKILRDDELVSHMNALVYEVALDGFELPFTSRNGEAFLARASEVDDLMDGIADFLEQLQGATEPFESTWRY